MHLLDKDDLVNEPLCIVVPTEGGYMISPVKGFNKPWVVVKSLNSESYVIN